MMLENKYYMENILTLTKSLITISLNGTIESSNKNVRKVFDESLKTLLSLQEKLFDELKEKKIYKIENVKEKDIKKKYIQLKNDSD